jgi:dTDP-4-dehydrorhamnose reductase
LPAEGLPVHPNFITNLLNAASTGQPLRFATHEYRGITDVGEVVEYLPKTFELPGGVYNYGAENELNTYETALRFVIDWQGEETANAIVVPDTERFAQQPRNISISTDKVTALSLGEIAFTETLEGLKRFVRKNHLSE